MDTSPSFAPLQLALAAQGQWYAQRVPAAIQGIHFDTRLLRPGMAFVALKSSQNDGHLFIDAAVRAGASAAIVHQPLPHCSIPQLVVADTFKAFKDIAKHHRQQFKGTIVGITGSCGKTSTKDLLVQLLGGTHVLGTLKNLNNTLGVPFMLLQLDAKRHTHAVIEAGMNLPGEMLEISSILQPDHAIVTLVAKQHLEGVGNLEAIAREKAYLPNSRRPGGLLICPKGCMDHSAFRDLPQPIILAEGNPEVSAGLGYSIQHIPNGKLELQMHFEGYKWLWQLPHMSHGMVSNTVLALMMALQLGIEPKSLQERLDTWMPSHHRGQWHTYGMQRYYVDCYNSGPASLQDSLQFFQTSAEPNQPRLYVVGPMNELGDESDALHYAAAQHFKLRSIDTVLIVHPKAQPMAQGLQDLGVASDQIRVMNDPLDAVPHIQGFEGSIFLKASNAYQLQRLLPK